MPDLKMNNLIQLDLFGDKPPVEDKAPDWKPETGLTVYKASAGSGKTYTLTLEYLKQALSSKYSANKFREILAVTFTNKATDEMKTRIITTLNNIANGKDEVIAKTLQSELGIDELTLKERAKKVQKAILHNYSDFSISTIDKFFQKVIHVFVREAGLRPGFRLELDQERIMDEAVDRMMLNLHKKEFLYRKMSDIVDEQMEKGSGWDVRRSLKEQGEEVLSEQFREFDYEFHQKIRDNAFMDSFTHEMGKMVDAFERKMNKIANGAVGLIESVDMKKSDFYYGKNGAVNYFYKLKDGKYDAPGTRVMQILDSEDDSIWLSKRFEDNGEFDIRQITGVLTISLKQAVDVFNREYPTYCTALCIKNAMNILSFLAEIETNVRQVANDENLMLISETTHLLAKLIGDSDPPFIYERAGSKYSTFMIDEFQDTSESQWHNFKPLLANSLAENKHSLVVGDVKQSIYRWRNGDWRILAYQIFNDFKEYTVREKNLDTNWRSYPNVVEFNNALFSLLPSFIEHNFTEGASENIISAAYSSAEQKVAEKNKNNGGYVSVTAIRDIEGVKSKEEILKRLPATIVNIQNRGYKARDIAILVRTAADGQAISDCLLNYKRTSGDTEHCFDIISPDSLFICKSGYVQFIISLFKAVINPNDDINNASLNHFINRENTSFTWKTANALSHEVKEFLAGMTSLSLPEVFEQIINRFNLGDNPIEVPYLQELHDEIIAFSNSELSDISAFLEHWENKGSNLRLSAGEAPDAINIMTIHKAKGLEYPVVLIPYCNWSMKPMNNSTVWVTPKTEPFDKLQHIPVTYNNTMRDSFFKEDYYYETLQSLVDNLNLLYVAFTRAKEELHVMLPLPAEPKYRNDNPDILRTASLTLFNFLENSTSFLKGSLAKQKAGNEYLFSFGRKKKKQEEALANFSGIYLNEYKSSPFDKKLRLKYESEDYFTDPNTPIQLRNYGNLMHKVFSFIHSVKDVPQAIEYIEDEGLLSKEYIPELELRVYKALQHAKAKDWFADNNQYKVITEKFLLLPASQNKGLSRRPDRIMYSPNETLVIDYKFGNIQEDSYHLQVKNYMSLLESMNFPNVKGYIWYVDMDIIEGI